MRWSTLQAILASNPAVRKAWRNAHASVAEFLNRRLERDTSNIVKKKREKKVKKKQKQQKRQKETKQEQQPQQQHKPVRLLLDEEATRMGYNFGGIFLF